MSEKSKCGVLSIMRVYTLLWSQLLNPLFQAIFIGCAHMAGMGLMGNGVFLMVLRYLAQILKSAQKRSLKLLVADVCVCVCGPNNKL